MRERGAWSASWIPPPPALTARRIGALEGNVNGEVPDECGGRDVALGGNLGDALLQALWGERGMSQGPALKPITHMLPVGLAGRLAFRVLTAVGTQSWP